MFYAQRATASGVFRPNREKDELTYAVGLLNTVAELEAKEVSHGSMDSLRTDHPTEATRERMKKRHSGSRGWRKRCVKHRSGKKP